MVEKARKVRGFYDLGKLLDHEIGVEYEEFGHEWINIKLPCGCTNAINIDIIPSDEMKEKYFDLSNKFDIINVYINNLSKEEYSLNDRRVLDLIREKRETTNSVFDLINEVKDKEKLGYNVDFNGTEFFVKLIKGETCNN